MNTNCPKCGSTHNPSKCQGHVIKDPDTREPIPPRQCSKSPMVGQTKCYTHGGNSRQAKAAAAERQAAAAAEKALGELVPLMAGATPISDPIDMLARCLSVMEETGDRLAKRINDLNGKVAAGQYLSQLRAEVAFWERTQDRIISGASKLAALGIAERQVELAAGQADLVVAAFRAGLAVAGSTLLPDVRDAMLRGFLEALGESPSGPPELGAAS